MKRMRNVLISLEFYRAPLFEGIAEYARTHNWHLSLDMLTNPSKIPWGWDGDGIITMLIQDETELVKFLNKKNKPTVNLEGRNLTTEYPRVLSNTRLAAELAFEYFREKGFEQFAFYGYQHSVRGADFQAVAKENSFPCSVFYEGGADWEKELENMEKWLKDQTFPLAVFCWTDYAGARFIDMAHSLGYKIPEQVAVLGMDNEELICDSTAVRLSSIKTELKLVGYLGAQALDKIMDGQEANENLLIPPSEVVQRGSTETLAIKDPNVKQAVEYMNKNYSKFINISDVVHSLDISRRSLETAFSKVLHQSPHETLLKIRLNRAKTLLHEKSQKISSVANSVGFSDPKYFSTVFKDHIGLSPRDFQKKL